ncbi:integrase core domain-containing protein, partial [Halopseudomonas formosensis]|uniref:integrase core domain-containing protein n=1 Tax=Halopseudomonas formosensis TaxID=1002526 RepID=UPI001C42FBCB
GSLWRGHAGAQVPKKVAAPSRLDRRLIDQVMEQEFIRPHTPQQNGMVERLIRTVKEQCLWLHNFQTLDEARQTLRAWFKYYNEQRPHQALGMKTPSTIYQQLAA